LTGFLPLLLLLAAAVAVATGVTALLAFFLLFPCLSISKDPGLVNSVISSTISSALMLLIPPFAPSELFC